MTAAIGAAFKVQGAVISVLYVVILALGVAIVVFLKLCRCVIELLILVIYGYFFQVTSQENKHTSEE